MNERWVQVTVPGQMNPQTGKPLPDMRALINMAHAREIVRIEDEGITIISLGGQSVEVIGSQTVMQGGFGQSAQQQTEFLNRTKSYTVVVREGVDHLIAGAPKGEIKITMRGNSKANLRSVSNILHNPAVKGRTPHIVLEDDGKGIVMDEPEAEPQSEAPVAAAAIEPIAPPDAPAIPDAPPVVPEVAATPDAIKDAVPA